MSHVIPDALFCRISNEGVLDFVAIGRQHPLWWVPHKHELEVVPNRRETMLQINSRKHVSLICALLFKPCTIGNL